MTLFPELAEQHDPGGKVRIRVPEHWHCAAEFSPCGKFRYKLLRRWDSGPLLLGLFMNPSTATERINDPTVAKWCKIAAHHGYAGCMVGNSGAYRLTHPDELHNVEDPIGPRNRAAILEMATGADRIVIAHGRLSDVRLQQSAESIVTALLAAGHDLYALRLLDDGVPSHPLARGRGHIPIETIPILWRQA